MKIKFHGARGSFPVSTPPKRIEQILESFWTFNQENKTNSWDESLKLFKKERRSVFSIFGSATTCLEVQSQYSPMSLFFDAGTGLTSAAFDPFSALSTSAFKQGRGKVRVD